MLIAAILVIAAAMGQTHHELAPSGYDTYQHYAQQVSGYGSGEMSCLVNLWNGESGWNPWIVSTVWPHAYGIPQINPVAHGHPVALGDWRGQIRWGLSYIHNVYGDACTAWTDWQDRSPHWY